MKSIHYRPLDRLLGWGGGEGGERGKGVSIPAEGVVYRNEYDIEVQLSRWGAAGSMIDRWQHVLIDRRH